MEKINTARLYYISVLTTLSAWGAWIVDAFFGGWDAGSKTLVALMAADYITGLAIALIWKKSPKSSDGRFESNASLKGLVRKGEILLIVYVASLLDATFSQNGYIRTTVILFFIANEGLSLIENAGIMGVPMPDALKNMFTEIKKQSESKKRIR